MYWIILLWGNVTDQKFWELQFESIYWLTYLGEFLWGFNIAKKDHKKYLSGSITNYEFIIRWLHLVRQSTLFLSDFLKLPNRQKQCSKSTTNTRTEDNFLRTLDSSIKVANRKHKAKRMALRPSSRCHSPQLRIEISEVPPEVPLMS